MKKNYFGIVFKNNNEGYNYEIYAQSENYLYYRPTGDEGTSSDYCRIDDFESDLQSKDFILISQPKVPFAPPFDIGENIKIPIESDGRIAIDSYEIGDDDDIPVDFAGGGATYRVGHEHKAWIYEIGLRHVVVSYIDVDDDEVEVIFLTEDLLKINNKTQTHGKASISSTKTCNKESSSNGVKVSKPVARVTEGERCSGSAISGRRRQVRIAVGHLSNQKINCK